MNVDPVDLMNLTFDVVIVLLAVFFSLKSKSPVVIGVATAFAFFAVSYALTITGFAASSALIPIRAEGYLSLVIGLILSSRH